MDKTTSISLTSRKKYDYDEDKYIVYFDENKNPQRFPPYYINGWEFLMSIAYETATLEDISSEFGYDTEETRRLLWEIGDEIKERLDKFYYIALNSLAENLVQEYDVIKVNGYKSIIPFYEKFHFFREQYDFSLMLKKNAEKYNKKIIFK